MESKTFSFAYTELEHAGELPAADQKLLQKAKESAITSYSPYSKYHVGAALRLENGEVITGSNQENVAYPSSLCAERVAAFYASAHYPGVPFETIAISAFADDFEVNEPVTPCGSCRQVLSEYENKSGKPIRIIMQGVSGKVMLVESIGSLLPFTFNETKLKK